MQVEEAIDLILTLGSGTAYMTALDPANAWNTAEYQSANLYDLLSIINWRLMRYGGPKQYEPIPVPRPGDAKRKARQQAISQDRAASVAAKLKNTKWEDI